jgi:hypothetical protein
MAAVRGSELTLGKSSTCAWQHVQFEVDVIVIGGFGAAPGRDLAGCLVPAGAWKLRFHDFVFGVEFSLAGSASV